jgi:pantothenate kinase type III
MSITLCFDFGNTRKKVAVFQDAEMKEAVTLQDERQRQECLKRHLTKVIPLVAGME